MRAGTKPTLPHPSAPSRPKLVPRLFGGLSDGDIAQIMAAGVVRKFASRQIIVRADDPGTHLLMLRTGSVNYYRVTPEGQQVLIIRLSSPGDTLGLGALLAEPVGYLGTAEALRDTELYVWEHKTLRRLVEKYPVLAENGLRISLEYIRLYSDRHLALVSNNAEDRLCRMLSLVAMRTGHRNSRGLEVQITNEHLASLADIGYHNASRLLNKWKRQGALEKSRGKIVILCPEKMIC